jgi:enolase
VKKIIASGKQGEAALKPYFDGSYICPADTIADNLKILEDAINQNQLKDIVSIGISWQADNLYIADKKVYELENPKQLLTDDQLVKDIASDYI